MAKETEGLNVTVGKTTMVKVRYKDGTAMLFNADDWAFIGNGNIVCISNGGETVAHVNWMETLSVSKD